MASQNGTLTPNVIGSNTEPSRVATAYKKRLRVRVSVLGGTASAYFATAISKLVFQQTSAPDLVPGAFEVAGGNESVIRIDAGEVLYAIAQSGGLRISYNACDVDNSDSDEE